MVKRALEQGDFSQQVGRLTSLNEELKLTVQGIKEGKKEIRRLHDKLKEEHSTLFQKNTSRLQELEKLHDRSRSSQEEKLRVLLDRSGRSLSELGKTMGERTEEARHTMERLTTEGDACIKNVQQEWAGVQKKQWEFTERVDERLSEISERVGQAEATVLKLGATLEDHHSALENMLSDCRWKIQQLELKLDQERVDHEGNVKIHRWAIGILLTGLVILVISLF